MTSAGTASQTAAAHRIAVLAALGTLIGVVLSGPATVALVSATHPQPPWRDAEFFAQSYHAIQSLPYLGGIVLVGALVVLMSSLHVVGRDNAQPSMNAALVFTGVFAAFIFFNYVVQTTFLPTLARRYDPSNAPLISALSMSNPTSLAWGIEMWGWGFLGAATWLAAGVFREGGVERAARLAFAANGPVSIVGALWTTVRPGWVMTPAGLVAFAVWNVLLAAMGVLAFLAFRRRLRSNPSPGPSHPRTLREQPAR
jgi:hypothetical protein